MTDDPVREERRLFALAFALLAPLYLAPLFVTRFLPAFDLPHHLGIADGLLKAGNADSPYAHLYSFQLGIAPFDLHFVLLVFLGRFTSLSIAAKVLVGAQVLVLPLTVARLLAACGRSVIPALLAFPLGYAMPVHFGLVAFVLAVPALVWVFAEAADRQAFTTRPWRQTAILAFALTVLFFFHLEAYAMGLAAAVLVVATHPAPLPRRGLGAAAAVPSLVLLVAYGMRTLRGDDARVGAPTTGTLVRAMIEARLGELGEHGFFGDILERVRLVPVHLLRGFVDHADQIGALMLLTIIGGLAVLAYVRFPAAQGARIAPLLLAGLAGAAYFGLPHHVHPHAHSVYPRFAVVLAITSLLAIPPRLVHASQRWKTGIVAGLFFGTAVYAAVVRREYAAFDKEIADFRRILDRAPPGHAAAGLVYDSESKVVDVGGIMNTLPTYYAAERRSPQTSTYLYYCRQPHLPCRMNAPDEKPAMEHFARPEAFDPERALVDLDLFFVRGAQPADAIFGTELGRVSLVAEEGTWRLFQRIP